MKQKEWFLLHHWAGFHLSLMLSFIVITGTFATISTDLDWLTNPSIRAVNQTQQKQILDWSALISAVKHDAPQAEILSIHRPPLPWHNIEVIARDQQGSRYRIYLDAYTHQITGHGKWLNWQRLFRQVHRHLMLQTQLGITIVGIFAIVLLFLLITALYTYKHWWRYFFSFKRVKWPANLNQQTSLRASLQTSKIEAKEAGKKRKFWAELHKIMGLWSIWFVVVISITGIWYLAERWGAGARYAEIVNPQIVANKTQSSALNHQLSTLMLSKAISYISQKHPDYTINQIRFIANKNLIEIAGQEHAILVRDRANIKLFDALNGVYIGGRNGEDLNWHFRISEAADPLHFGTFDSWIYRYLWFAFGLGLSLLCLSGVYMFTLRLKQTSDFSTLKNGHWLRILWQKTHWLKWPSLVLLVMCCLLTFIDFVVK